MLERVLAVGRVASGAAALDVVRVGNCLASAQQHFYDFEVVSMRSQLERCYVARESIGRFAASQHALHSTWPE